MSTTYPRAWAEWTSPNFDTLRHSNHAARAVAVLPVAAVEQHGPHLPTGVDTFLIQAMLERALALLPPELPTPVLPVQAIGLSPEHGAFAGTLSLQPSTVLALWQQLGHGVARSGLRKLLLLNGHGGQASLTDAAARMLRTECGLTVVTCNWYQLPMPEVVRALFSEHEHRFGVHAGDMETSIMLALAPQLVRMQHAADFASTSEQRARTTRVLGNGVSAKLAWQAQDLNPAGAVGNASAASAPKGQAVLAAVAQSLAELIQDIAELEPLG